LGPERVAGAQVAYFMHGGNATNTYLYLLGKGSLPRRDEQATSPRVGPGTTANATPSRQPVPEADPTD
jgi:hypothetical protein